MINHDFNDFSSKTIVHEDPLVVETYGSGPSRLSVALSRYDKAYQDLCQKRDDTYRSLIDMMGMGDSAAAGIISVPFLMVAAPVLLPADVLGYSVHKIQHTLLNNRIQKHGIDALIPDHIKKALIEAATASAHSEGRYKNEQALSLDLAESYARDKGMRSRWKQQYKESQQDKMGIEPCEKSVMPVPSIA